MNMLNIYQRRWNIGKEFSTVPTQNFLLTYTGSFSAHQDGCCRYFDLIFFRRQIYIRRLHLRTSAKLDIPSNKALYINNTIDDSKQKLILGKDCMPVTILKVTATIYKYFDVPLTLVHSIFLLPMKHFKNCLWRSVMLWQIFLKWACG